MSADKPRRLGRGLEALIGTSPTPNPDVPSRTTPGTSELRRIPLDQIHPNRYQPRREFVETELADLRASIAASGLLQPLVARPSENGFELISGERRLRAATQLGWTEVPVLVRQVDDRAMLTLALIENLQRADLNVIEAAQGYRRLQDEFSLTHQQISEAVGKDRTTITNALRLLSLPEAVQELVRSGKLSMGHARALLGVRDARVLTTLAHEAVTEDLSVREVERRTRETGVSKPAPRRRSSDSAAAASSEPTAPSVRSVQDTLRRHFQTDVDVRFTTPSKGYVQLAFYSPDDLNRLLDLLVGERTVGD